MLTYALNRYAQNPHCPDCGYSLHSLAAGASVRCPECGSTFPILLSQSGQG
jgi:tRNA(Ile2) C34 agmatinyltransferase TiaS